MRSAAAKLPPQRTCARCGHKHYATICHICKRPDPSALFRFCARIEAALFGARRAQGARG